MELTKTRYGSRGLGHTEFAEGGTIEYNADGLPLEQTSEAMLFSRFRLVSRCLPMGGQPWSICTAGGFFSSMFFDGTAARLCNSCAGSEL